MLYYEESPEKFFSDSQQSQVVTDQKKSRRTDGWPALKKTLEERTLEKIFVRQRLNNSCCCCSCCNLEQKLVPG